MRTMPSTGSPNFSNTKTCLGLIKKEKLDKTFNSTKSGRISPHSPPSEKIVKVKPSLIKPKTYPAEAVFTPAESPKKKSFCVRNNQSFVPKINAANPALCNKSSLRKPCLKLQNRRTEHMDEKNGDAVSYSLSDQISYMCSTLHQQLIDMESVENDIRKRWKGIKYDIQAESRPLESSSNIDILQTPIKLQGGKENCQKHDKQIVRFVKQKPEPQSRSLAESPPVQNSAKVLTIPTSIIDAVHQNKSEFSKFLHSVHHEPVGKFNPWKVVNELSKEIVDKIVSDVCNEVSDGFDECVERVFEAEFAMPT